MISCDDGRYIEVFESVSVFDNTQGSLHHGDG